MGLMQFDIIIINKNNNNTKDLKPNHRNLYIH